MDNTPGVTWAGDPQTDFGGFGLYDDAAGSVWGPGRFAPPALDPTLTDAARVNYAGPFAPPAAEGFATKRYRFAVNPLLAHRRDALVENLKKQEAAADAIPYDRGYEDAGVTPGSDPYGEQLVNYGRDSFSSRREGVDGNEPAGFLDGLLSDRDLLVLVFVMLIFLVLQGMIASAVVTACAAAPKKNLAAEAGE